MSDKNSIDNPLTFTVGDEQLVIRRSYEVISIINDFFIAGWFLSGSVFFLYPSMEKVAIWLFIIGSAQFLIRPTIRLLPIFIYDECQVAAGNCDNKRRYFTFTFFPINPNRYKLDYRQIRQQGVSP
jgi:hypothetical protein